MSVAVDISTVIAKELTRPMPTQPYKIMEMEEQRTVPTLASQVWAIDKCKSPVKLIVQHWKAIHRQYMLWANGLVPCHLHCIVLIKC